MFGVLNRTKRDVKKAEHDDDDDNDTGESGISYAEICVHIIK